MLQGALVPRSLEGSGGRWTFTLCCDDLDLQPVEAGRVQVWHHQNIGILGEEKGQTVREVEEKAEEKFQMLKVCEIVGKLETKSFESVCQPSGPWDLPAEKI